MADERRRLQFGNAQVLVQQECERLGLFKTRPPRFSQLFFYDFDGGEVATRAGQLLTIKASQRGAKAYLRSGARLESKCGISDVWYSYLLQNKALFVHPDSPPPVQEPANPGPYPRLEFHHLPSIYCAFRWKEEHTTLHSQEQGGGDDAVGVETNGSGPSLILEGYTPSVTASPFCRAAGLTHKSLLSDVEEEADRLVDRE